MASPPPKDLERSSFLRTEDEQSEEETEVETAAVERKKVAAKKTPASRKTTGKRKTTSPAASTETATSKAPKSLSISSPSASMRKAETSESEGSDDSPEFLREEKGKKKGTDFSSSHAAPFSRRVKGRRFSMRLAENNFKTVGANETVDLRETSPEDSSTFAQAKSSTVDKVIESTEDDVDDEELERDVFGRMNLFSSFSVEKGKNAFEEQTVASSPTKEEIQVATSVLGRLIEGNPIASYQDVEIEEILFSASILARNLELPENKRKFSHDFPIIFQDFTQPFAEKEKAAEATAAAKKDVEDSFAPLSKQKEEYEKVKEEINTQHQESQKLEEELAQLEAQMSKLKTRISGKQKALADMKIRRKQLLDGLDSQLKKLEPKRVAAEALEKKNQGITQELTAMQLEWQEWRNFL
ncbi:hypothetical protein SLEP1_g7068 [Rubroshorea leprosula]|uniref:Uncharacterized protein n=1 Tax=Rubroshorea leprosula TaxID=152421 RepID=A0AAV5I845_9ROSI|nr:hypothetical protein SLEP1_g7068 [Rubroshorea leprosula]